MIDSYVYLNEDYKKIYNILENNLFRTECIGPAKQIDDDIKELLNNNDPILFFIDYYPLRSCMICKCTNKCTCKKSLEECVCNIDIIQYIILSNDLLFNDIIKLTPIKNYDDCISNNYEAYKMFDTCNKLNCKDTNICSTCLKILKTLDPYT
jgi:hypothetical protein